MYAKVMRRPLSSSVSRTLRAKDAMTRFLVQPPGRHRCGYSTKRSFRKPSRRQQHARDQNEPAERERQEHLPPQPHQLVVAVTREGRANPQEEEQHQRDLQRKP